MDAVGVYTRSRSHSRRRVVWQRAKIFEERSEDVEVSLTGAAAHMHRRIAARLNHLAQDRADFAFATKDGLDHDDSSKKEGLIQV